MKRLLRKQQRGAVALIVALSLVAMIGFLGLVVDLGRLYINKSELANAADACALAAARELGVPPIADSLQRAVAAGQLVGGRNNVDFQGNPVTVSASDITFSDKLASEYKPYGSADPAKAKYVRCELPRSGILPWFMQVLGIGAQSVSAQAVASQQQSQISCGLPLGICKPTPPQCLHGGTPDAYGFCKGEWYGSKLEAGITGSFNWIDYTPSGGGSNELSDLISGTGECNLKVKQEVGAPGNKDSLDKAWNSRFGVYQGNLRVSDATPDFTGHAYTPKNWSSTYNAFADFKIQRKTYEKYQKDTESELGLNTNGNLYTGDLSQVGADRRVVTIPIMDCKDWGKTNHKAPIQAFACVLMLHPMSKPLKGEDPPALVEYLGRADEPGSPCITQGLPGSGVAIGPKVPGLVR
ncbi:pilus assembly protein TadG-related protein [Crenobacter intestini]|uniref:Putative Flp pilus-assembly TadG-like N-terminal domain-containing protein n=1 Tax=Crenobacter intestini TaxID=2563443 RepID=A0A4T0V159_9NEIS|nr:pilus assembly protein TadG-related protein [Crenobacter intestini]TIC85248.1 hypothetical protein E5K04_04420 [Crenobacter intestini]